MIDRRAFPLLLALTLVVNASCQQSDELYAADAAPARRRAAVSRPTSPNRITFVAAGSSLQNAIDAAQPGDVLVLQAGATYTGPFKLRRKSGDGWIVIQSSALTRLPRQGVRVTPADSSLMTVLTSDKQSVLTTESGAHHYWFIGVEIRPQPGAFLHNLVQLGAGERSVEALPHHFVFERCYIHGDPQVGGRRGIAMNSGSAAVLDSYVADFKEIGADSQAIASWNGSGPFDIVNNYLEAAGENVMFGGDDPSIPGLVPSDIEIKRNHFFKPLSWRVGDPAYAGKDWSVKNLFELKNARRVRIDGNLFEYNWPHAQNGFAILFTVRNQEGESPWSVVEDVEFTNNIVRHVASGLFILGRDDNYASEQTKNIIIRNNLFEDVGGPWGRGRLFQVLDGATEVVIEQNTAVHTDSFLVAENAPNTRFAFRNNIVQQAGYGVVGTGSGPGLPTLHRFFPEAEMTGNAIIGGEADDYPPGNVFPRSIEEAGFIDPKAGDYRLSASSPIRDIGVDFAALAAAQQSASPGKP